MSINKAKLRDTSFKAAEENPKRRLIVSATGKEKTGKTHFALSAPDPIAYQSLDIGMEGVLDKFLNGETAAKEIYLSEYTAKPKVAEKDWERFRKDFRAALDMGVKTIVWDSATEVWEMVRLAKLGKLAQVMPHQYGPVNAEFRTLLREVYDSDVNFILLHKVKKMYVNDKWNGKYERAGFNDIAFLVQCVTEVGRYPLKDEDHDREFYLDITDCRQNAECAGERLEGEMCNFTYLAMTVFPNSEESDWE